jgi:hypothetical protein
MKNKNYLKIGNNKMNTIPKRDIKQIEVQRRPMPMEIDEEGNRFQNFSYRKHSYQPVNPPVQ